MTAIMGYAIKHVRKHGRRIIGGIIGVGVVIGLGGSALAADLPPPRAPAVYVPAVLPIYNWAGIYIGVNGGWGWGNAKYTANAFAGFPGTTDSLSDNGGVVGGTLGANFQCGAFVFGVEGDWDYSAINTGTTSSICTFSGNCQTGNNWLATARRLCGGSRAALRHRWRRLRQCADELQRHDHKPHSVGLDRRRRHRVGLRG